MQILTKANAGNFILLIKKQSLKSREANSTPSDVYINNEY